MNLRVATALKVSAGIGSYLARLEEKPKDTSTTVYNRLPS